MFKDTFLIEGRECVTPPPPPLDARLSELSVTVVLELPIRIGFVVITLCKPNACIMLLVVLHGARKPKKDNVRI